MTERWAIVTGAAGDIGGTVARALATEGYRVAAWDRVEGRTAQLLSDLGGEALAAVVDVTDEGSIERALDSLGEPPALLVNCAGLAHPGSLLEIDVADWRRLIDVNLTGTFLCARHVARGQRESGGAIVNVTSVSGLAAVRNAGPYSSSKAAVVRLTEQMAIEWAPFGIRVNAIAPGAINAGLTLRANLAEEIAERRNARIPLGRLGEADEVAAAVVYLASPRASYVTGETLAVDGGLTKTVLSSMPTGYDPE